MPSDQSEQLATVSTEALTTPSHAADASVTCARCGAALAADQRYCLECGERRVPMSSVLLAGLPGRGEAEPAAVPSAPPTIAGPPLTARGTTGRAGGRAPNNTLTVIAGVGVLLLAMGVGVLIGRSGASKQAAGPAQVITVAGGGAPAATTSTPAATEAAFTGDWPAGTSGYTVELKTLPTSGTAVSAVQAAKSEATTKGAKSVGALKSEEFSTLPAGSYVIYSGVYHKQAEAQKALVGLQRSFPGAKVIHVASGESSAATSKEEAKEIAKESGKGVGESLSKPAPPSVVKSLNKVKGKNYSEKSKNIPNVVSTG